jgi:hypothetical protein
MKNVYRKAGKSALASLFASALIFSGCQKENFLKDDQLAPAETSGNSQSLVIAPGQEFVPNQILVKFKTGVAEGAKASALSKINGEIAEKLLTKAMQFAGDTEGVLLINTSLMYRRPSAG